jgi:chromosome segregation ATPase
MEASPRTRILFNVERVEDEIVPLHQPFDVALRGFDRHQVLDHIDSLKGQIDLVERDRDAALAHTAELRTVLEHLRAEGAVLAHLHRQVDAANEQMHRLQQSPIVGVPERIQQMLTLAEEEAAEMRARARAETDELRSRAETETAEMRNRTESEATALGERARAESERLSRDTAARCERLEAAMQRRCEEADHRCQQEIARRHDEATRQIAEQEKQSLARMHLMMRAVGDQVDAARHEIESLTTLRAEIAAQLAAADRLLAAAIEHVHDTGVKAHDEPKTVPSLRLGAVVPG